MKANTFGKTFDCASAGDEKVYEVVLGKLDKYFVPKVNVIHERARFHLRAQKNGEGVEGYICSLHELTDKCDFGAMKSENVRDRCYQCAGQRDVTGVKVVLKSCQYYCNNLHRFILFNSPLLNVSFLKCFNILIPVWSRKKLETLVIVSSKRFVQWLMCNFQNTHNLFCFNL